MDIVSQIFITFYFNEIENYMRPTTQVSAYRCLRLYAWVSPCILTETFKLDSKSVRLTSSIGSGVLPKCLHLCSWIVFKGWLLLMQ